MTVGIYDYLLLDNQHTHDLDKYQWSGQPDSAPEPSSFYVGDSVWEKIVKLHTPKPHTAMHAKSKTCMVVVQVIIKGPRYNTS